MVGDVPSNPLSADGDSAVPKVVVGATPGMVASTGPVRPGLLFQGSVDSVQPPPPIRTVWLSLEPSVWEVIRRTADVSRWPVGAAGRANRRYDSAPGAP